MSERVHIDLDLVVEGGEVRGSAADGRQRRRFAGWLGLIAALDALVERRDRAATPPSRNDTPGLGGPNS